MTNDEAIDLAKRAIKPCKGITMKALQLVIKMAEKYNEGKEPPVELEQEQYISEQLESLVKDYEDLCSRILETTVDISVREKIKEFKNEHED